MGGMLVIGDVAIRKGFRLSDEWCGRLAVGIIRTAADEGPEAQMLAVLNDRLDSRGRCGEVWV